MISRDIHNLGTLSSFCEEFNCGSLNERNLSLIGLTGYVLNLYGLEKLAINVEEGSRSGNINLIKGSFTEVRIPNGIKINLKEVEYVDTLICQDVCSIKNSTIRYCESNSGLLITDCAISELKHSDGQLSIEDCSIEQITCISSYSSNNFRIKNISYFFLNRLRTSGPIDLSLKFKRNSEFQLLNSDFTKMSFTA